MTQTFPLSLSEFALDLPIKSFAWKLFDQQNISGLGGGVIITADIGPRYWGTKVLLDNMSHEDAADIDALINSLDGALFTFYMHDPRRPYPRNDPTGAILTADGGTVRIAEIRNNNKEMKFKGLPPGYGLRRGDWFSFDYAADPVHRAYHQISTASVTADGLGNTDWIEFRPHLLPGAAVNDVITLKRAAAQVVILPKSYNEGQPQGTRNYGMSFEIRQVL